MKSFGSKHPRMSWCKLRIAAANHLLARSLSPTEELIVIAGRWDSACALAQADTPGTTVCTKFRTRTEEHWLCRTVQEELTTAVGAVVESWRGS